MKSEVKDVDAWRRELSALKGSGFDAPGARAPHAGEQWRVNFSRVQWPLDVRNGRYVKRTNETGELLPEDNWVWSPQGAIAMHMPERWGYVQFSDAVIGQPFRAAEFIWNPDEDVRWSLRRLYYRQTDYRKANGRYARALAELGAPDVKLHGVQLHATDDLYVMTAPATAGGVITLRQDGKVWRTEKQE